MLKCWIVIYDGRKFSIYFWKYSNWCCIILIDGAAFLLLLFFENIFHYNNSAGMKSASTKLVHAFCTIVKFQRKPSADLFCTFYSYRIIKSVKWVRTVRASMMSGTWYSKKRVGAMSFRKFSYKLNNSLNVIFLI